MGQNNGTVVLVHSSASSGKQWRALSDRLSNRFIVTAPDLNGYGPSARDPGSFTYDDDCELVEGLIVAAKEPVHLVGHSYGGLLSAQAALKRPQLIRSLTLIEPVCFFLLDEVGDIDAYAEILTVSQTQIANTQKGDLMGAAEGFVTYWMGPEAWERMPPHLKTVISGIMPKVAREWDGVFGRSTPLARFAEFPVETLMIKARDTTLAANNVVDLLAKHIPAPQLTEIPSGGHMSPVTNGDPVNDAIEQFLTRG